MHGVLPNWLERLLGLEPAEPGQGTFWELEHSWSWPPSLTLLLVTLAIAWVVLFYRREAAGRRYRTALAMLRLIAIGLVLLMIAELTLTLRRTGLPSLVVAVDDSESMGIEDADDAKAQRAMLRRLEQAGFQEPTRLNIAKTVLLGNRGELVRKLERDYKLKLYLVSVDARPQADERGRITASLRDARATGSASRLGDGLEAILRDSRGTPPAAILLLSDGITTDGESLSGIARVALSKGVPIFTIGTGSERAAPDLEVSELLVDEVVFVDDVVNFEAKVRAQGVSGREVEVSLRKRGEKDVLAQTRVPIEKDGQPQSVRLPYRPTEAGQFDFVVDVQPLEGERDTGNNSQQRSVTVRKERIRVLLAQAYPSYEFRYLSNMLARDKTVDLKTVLQDADLEHAAVDASALQMFPTGRDELFHYDVLILGDLNPALLSAPVLDNIRAFVERKGGGVAIIAGEKYIPAALAGTPLEVLMPFELAQASAAGADAAQAGFKLRLTDIGLAMPHLQLGDSAAESQRLWSGLPMLYGGVNIHRTKPAVRVLVEQDSPGPDRRPLVMLQYFGAGKVLFQATDETWRWRFRVGDALFARYWGQTVRMLSRAKLLDSDRGIELTVDQPEVRRGETVRLRARFFDERLAPAADDGVQAVVEREGKPNEPVTLRRTEGGRGIFEASLTAQGEGRYHVRLVAPAATGKPPSADFRVVASPGESQRTTVDAKELRAAAKISGGKFYRSPDAASLLDDLPAGRQVPIEPLPPIRLWNRWWMMTALVVALSMEWILRKRKGML